MQGDLQLQECMPGVRAPVAWCSRRVVSHSNVTALLECMRVTCSGPAWLRLTSCQSEPSLQQPHLCLPCCWSGPRHSTPGTLLCGHIMILQCPGSVIVAPDSRSPHWRVSGPEPLHSGCQGHHLHPHPLPVCKTNRRSRRDYAWAIVLLQDGGATQAPLDLCASKHMACL